MIRSGIGYDIHRFADGLKLILGGVEIAHARGLEGHSDADVLSHAIADALLGAIGAGDIGQHFPNTDESIRGISSMEILKRVGNLLNERNARVINVDATVIAEAPKLAPHGPAMRQEHCGSNRCERIRRERESDDERKARPNRTRRRHRRNRHRHSRSGVMECWSNAVVIPSEA